MLSFLRYLLSEAPLPPEVEATAAKLSDKGASYSKIAKEAGLPRKPFGRGGGRAVVTDDNPLLIHVHQNARHEAKGIKPKRLRHDTVTKIATTGTFWKSEDPNNNLGRDQNKNEFSQRNKWSVLTPHPNGKKHHYVENPNGILPPIFSMSGNGSTMVVGKVRPLEENEDYDNEIRRLTRTSTHRGVTETQLMDAIESNRKHPNEVAERFRQFYKQNPHLVPDIAANNLGEYQGKLVLLDSGLDEKHGQ